MAATALNVFDAAPEVTVRPTGQTTRGAVLYFEDGGEPGARERAVNALNRQANVAMAYFTSSAAQLIWVEYWPRYMNAAEVLASANGHGVTVKQLS